MLLARRTRRARVSRWSIIRSFGALSDATRPDDIEPFLLAQHNPSFLSDEWGLTFGERLRILARTSTSTSRASPTVVSRAKSNALSVSLFRPSTLPSPQSLSLSPIAIQSPSLSVKLLPANDPPEAVSLINFLEGKTVDPFPIAIGHSLPAKQQATVSSNHTSPTPHSTLGHAHPADTDVEASFVDSRLNTEEQHAKSNADVNDLDVEAVLTIDQHRDILDSIDRAVVAATEKPVRPLPAFNPGNLGPQSIEFFRAQFIKDLKRGDARQAVRRTHRLLFKKSFISSPERSRFFHSAISLLIDHGEYESAVAMHDWMASEGFVTPPDILGRFLRIASNEEEILDCLAVISDSPVLVDEPLFSRSLSKLHSLGADPQALLDHIKNYSAALRTSWTPGYGITCLMINAYAKAGDFITADRWMQDYRSTAKTTVPAPYTALLAAHVRADDNASALRVLEMMHTDGIDTPLGVFNLLLTLKPAPGEPESAGVERVFRVARIMPPDIWNRADKFTFAALFKAHERWRAEIITRTGPPAPPLRELFRAMVVRGIQGLETLAMRAFLVRHDYAGALVALNAHRAPTSRVRTTVEEALWRRMRGELGAETYAEAEMQARSLLRDDISESRDRRRREIPKARWTNNMLAEPGGLLQRGKWLRRYVASGNTSGHRLNDVFNWLLRDVPEPINPNRRKHDGRHGVNIESVRVLLRRAILASKDVSVLAPVSVQTNILDSELGRACSEMLPTTSERKSGKPRLKNAKRF